MPSDKSLNSLSGKMATTVIFILALAVLLWSIMDAYQRYQAYTSGENAPVKETAALDTPQHTAPKNTRAVAQQHIFGVAGKTGDIDALTQAPATRLNLKLIGVIAAKDNQLSSVIIQINNTDFGIYSIGDKLPQGDATIEKIEATQVLLKRGGKLESLAIIRPVLENKIPEEDEGL